MNKKENNSLKAVILAVIPLILVVAIFATAINMGIMTGTNTISNNKNPETTNEINATITIDFGNGTEDTYKIKTTNTTAYDFLIEAAKIGGYDIKTTYYGIYDSLLVESISNIENGQDNKYWIYYINGESGSIAADKQIIENNDLIEWKFEEYTY